MAASYNARVEDTWDFDITPQQARELDLAPEADGWQHLLSDGRAYRVRVEAADPATKTYAVRIGGNTYRVRLLDALDRQIREMGLQLQSARNISRIEAPMPGLILSVQVSVGDTVRKGDPLLVLEAMKMENAILAPQDGVVKQVAVRQGEAVEKKSLLVEFE
ncbi:biotin/lipoyl-binding protein [Robiginitalea sp. M366]|uniref:acetyl-CoA carboxylase biotin carboxyl carrier protein subunit n=1 Tax=Robiginitalea aestuariiviva TaxID=3036903 RepID=UPI00240DD5E2|nr:biotin/lipoyl-containing protein [Robiginitalea aestuariiviva]MDG1573261.1 biotin/lipoyl-binding protein [Robiginitalea aestuariiviva]